MVDKNHEMTDIFISYFWMGDHQLGDGIATLYMYIYVIIKGVRFSFVD
jgi:hypothetical protein